MMNQTLDIEGLHCEIFGNSTNKITYTIYPSALQLPAELLQDMAKKYATSVVTLYIPSDEWNNYLTPWPEPPEANGFPPFAGQAAKFLSILTEKIVPQVEKLLNIEEGVERNLIGVSLSGLFTLWEWLQCDVFSSIASLSGSFWYAGFMDWFNARQIPAKAGSAFFLLGKEEPKAGIKAYRPVGTNTEAIVERLKANGIKVEFSWVPGNHFADPLKRLELAFTHI